MGRILSKINREKFDYDTLQVRYVSLKLQSENKCHSILLLVKIHVGSYIFIFPIHDNNTCKMSSV